MRAMALRLRVSGSTTARRAVPSENTNAMKADISDAVNPRSAAPLVGPISRCTPTSPGWTS